MNSVLFAVSAGALIGFAFSRLPQTNFGMWFASLTSPVKLVLAALLLGVIGQFGRIPPLSGDLLLADLLIVLAAAWFGVELLFGKRKLIGSPTLWVLIAFAGYIVLGLGASLVPTTYAELAKGLLYAIRLISYLTVPLILAGSKLDRSKLLATLKWAMLAVVGLGFLQLLLVPDIGFLNVYGWDPHIGRLVSTFLDPNFLGGYLALLIAILFAEAAVTKKYSNWPWLVLTLIAAVLTYSRSGYIAVFAVVVVAGLLYSWRALLVCLLIVLPLGLSIPRVQQRIMGGFTIDVTSQARISSWADALTIASGQPLTGVGYNLYGQAQQKEGIRKLGDTSRAANGSDSSLLNIIATLGTIGFALVVALGFRLFGLLRKQWRGSDVTRKIAAHSIVFASLGLLANSFFVNALFYPLLLLPMMVLLSLLLDEAE